MTEKTIEQQLQFIATTAGLAGFTGDYQPLGGGEVNDTYLLDLGSREVVVRIAKDRGQQTLRHEAKALDMLNISGVPELLFFDPQAQLDGKLWIVVERMPGKTPSRLTVPQYRALGELLAEVHISTVSEQVGVDAWKELLKACKSFGDEQFLRNHPDEHLRVLIQKAAVFAEEKQAAFDHVAPCLIHCDATPSNTLVDGDSVALIDWEFAKINDPMVEFSTIYYDDMEYNRGKWRVKILPEEKAALYEGYKAAGGTIDEDRVSFWMTFDKLGAAIFLYWRLHQSERQTSEGQAAQYRLDMQNLLTSLEKSLS